MCLSLLESSSTVGEGPGKKTLLYSSDFLFIRNISRDTVELTRLLLNFLGELRQWRWAV